MVSSSLGLGTNPGVACTMPSLILSRQIAGHPTARATLCASVVLPVPGGPLTTTSVGREVTHAVIAEDSLCPESRAAHGASHFAE